MGEITAYFGEKAMVGITDMALEKSQKFIAQSGSTKLALADELKVENETLKIAAHELIETLDETEADRELKIKTIKKYEEVFGTKNEEFIQQHHISVVRKTDEKSFAKRALWNHLERKYNSTCCANEVSKQLQQPNSQTKLNK
jgi:hypothetical protein